jgi:hypothetical protein
MNIDENSMSFDHQLTQTLQAQRDTIPPFDGTLNRVEERGGRRLRFRRTGFVSAVALGLAAVVFAGSAVVGQPATALSPATGDSLVVISETPTILRSVPEMVDVSASLGDATDLNFSEIDKPEGNDLAAVQEIIDIDQYTDPVVVAIGSIDEFSTRIYMVHGTTPDGTHMTSVVAVDPSYPSSIAQSGPTGTEVWGPSVSRSLDGSGHAFMRVATEASYATLTIGETTSFQSPSDGFVWMPFMASTHSEGTFTVFADDGTVLTEVPIPALPCHTEAECQA